VAIKINFEWTRAFAKKADQPAYAIKAGKIQQIGRGKQPYNPFETGSPFLHFSQLKDTPEACIDFAERYGLLTAPAVTSDPLPAEDLAFWKTEIRKMATLVRMLPNVIKVANSRGTFARVGSVDVLLVPGTGPNAKPVMVFEPGNLLQAMNLELAHFISGGGTLLVCQQCNLQFRAGAGDNSRRNKSKFCSDKCKHDYHNARRGRQ
jgi:hypothetical protein